MTNVTQLENQEALQSGATLVYHLPLSALLLHTLYSSTTLVLSRWLESLPSTPAGKHLLNLAASHDGVGLTWCAGILTEEQTRYLCECARARGGIVQTRKPTVLSTDADAVPWEINITYYSACAPTPAPLPTPTPAPAPAPTPEPAPAPPTHTAPCDDTVTRMRAHVDRFLATQTVVVALRGVPALYFSLFVAGENDIDGMQAIKSANLGTCVRVFKYARVIIQA